jgi:hypothetical protein
VLEAPCGDDRDVTYALCMGMACSENVCRELWRHVGRSVSPCVARNESMLPAPNTVDARGSESGQQAVPPSSRVSIPLPNTPLCMGAREALRSILTTSDNGLYVNQPAVHLPAVSPRL